MTLVLTLAAPRVVVQAADTRLTFADGHREDGHTRATIVHCRDGKVAVAHTGLAYFDRQRTDEWLARKLYDFKTWESSTSDMAAFLTTELNSVRSSLPGLRQHGLTVVIGGLGFDPGPRVRRVITTITNQQVHDPSKDQFVDADPATTAFEHYSLSNPAFYFGAAGALSEGYWKIASPFRARVLRAARKVSSERDLKRLMGLTATMVRLAQRDPVMAPLISREVIVTAIKADLGSASQLFDRAGNHHVLPNRVTAKGLEIGVRRNLDGP